MSTNDNHFNILESFTKEQLNIAVELWAYIDSREQEECTIVYTLHGRAIKIDKNSGMQKILNGIPTIKEKKKIVLKYLKCRFCNNKESVSTIKTIYLTGIGINKLLHDNFETKIRVAPYVKQLMEVSTPVGDAIAKDHKRFSKFYYYISLFSIGNELYECRLNVGLLKKIKELRLYEINSIKKK